MSRIRNVKPDFFRHEGLQDLERLNAGKYPMFVFEGIWTKCDLNGIFEWRLRRLKLDILPFLDFDMEETLQILETTGYVKKYEIEGKEYGVVPTFLKHQKISKGEKDNMNIFPLPPKNSKPLENHPQTYSEPTQEGSETPEYGVRKSEFGNSENGNSEGACAPVFSLSQNLNLNSQTFETNFAKLQNTWNDLKVGPPYKWLQTNIPPPEFSDIKRFLTNETDSVKIGIAAMRNYCAVLNAPDKFDPGGHKGYSFVSFLTKGFQHYRDEAEPMVKFKIKRSGFSPHLNLDGKKSLGAIANE
jgi:hypothetical protein